MVDLSVEYMASLNFTGGLITEEQVFSPLNWRENISGEPLRALNYTPTTPRTQLPGGDNTRGAYIGRIVSQVLSRSFCELVPNPPAPGEGDRTLAAQNTTTSN